MRALLLIVLLAAAGAGGWILIQRAGDGVGSETPRAGDGGQGVEGRRPTPLKGELPPQRSAKKVRDPAVATKKGKPTPPAPILASDLSGADRIVFDAIGDVDGNATNLVNEWIERREEYQQILQELLEMGEGGRAEIDHHNRQLQEQYDRLVESAGQQGADRIMKKVIVYHVDVDAHQLMRIGAGGEPVPVDDGEDASAHRR